MVGAGISYPSVPLAKDIVTACKQVAQKHGRSTDTQGTNGLDQYSHWFETAYGERYQRQRYLRELIEGKPITHANFRLAHLLLDSTVSNIVVTTNFDDFLTKALALFGKTHIVCDHPQTMGRINHTAPVLQIVHLHGSYWFYDCCNLTGELKDRAAQSQHTTLTMASLLDMILWDRSPLVIGYSGWEGDVFIEALRRRLATPLSSNIYWFCYRRTEVESIPDWLKYHPDILFVVPAKKPTLKPEVDPTRIERVSETNQTSVEGIDLKGVSPIKDNEPVLPADTVFDKLITAFDLKAPELTKDPLGFLAKHLDNSLPKDSASDTSSDIYGIKSVVEKVRRAKQRGDDEDIAKTITTPSENRLEQIRDALRRADYQAAIARGTKLDLEDLSVEELDELADAMSVAAGGLSNNSEEAISAYDTVVAIRDYLVKEHGRETHNGKVQTAKALFNKGVALGALKRSTEAIAAYEEIENRYAKEPEVLFKEYVARALRNKGVALGALNRADEEIEIFDELVKRYGDEPGAILREQVAAALINKGYALGILNKNEEAVAVYDEAVQRYIDDPEAALRGLLAMALRNKGVTLGALNRHQEAIAAFDEVVKRYAEDPAPALREQVAKALVNKGFRLAALDRFDEAIPVYDEMIRRYGEDTATVIREQVGVAVKNKNILVNLMNQRREAAARTEKTP